VSNLSGKKALVTGAGMGIGQGIAVELARRGAEVAIHYAHTEPEETVSQIEKLGGKATTAHGDLSKIADCERTVDTAAEALGGHVRPVRLTCVHIGMTMLPGKEQ
jgi:glucose 1-dehydrogenase